MKNSFFERCGALLGLILFPVGFAVIGFVYGGFSGVLLGVFSILFLVSVVPKFLLSGIEHTCDKCKKFNSLKELSIAETHSTKKEKYTETDSRQTGSVYQCGSFLPKAKIYETYTIEHQRTIEDNTYNCVCMCCGAKQKLRRENTYNNY